MDFGTYNRAERAQEGEWMHVLHPETTRPLYLHMDGKKATASDVENDAPVRVLVQGVHSPALRKMHKAYENKAAGIRARMGRATGAGELRNLQKQIAELEEQHGLDMIKAAILNWENLPYLAEVLPFSDEAKDKIVPYAGQLDCSTEWLAEDVARFSRDRSNFFQTPATD